MPTPPGLSTSKAVLIKILYPIISLDSCILIRFTFLIPAQNSNKINYKIHAYFVNRQIK
jgi:hypothetical protein